MHFIFFPHAKIINNNSPCKQGLLVLGNLAPPCGSRLQLLHKIFVFHVIVANLYKSICLMKTGPVNVSSDVCVTYLQYFWHTWIFFPVLGHISFYIL